MVHVINYVRARGRVFFSERSERRLGARDVPAKRVAGGAPITQLCGWLGSGCELVPSLAAPWWARHAWEGRGAGELGGSCQRTRWHGDACQPVVQGRSLSGVSIAQMCLILSPPATSNAYTPR